VSSAEIGGLYEIIVGAGIGDLTLEGRLLAVAKIQLTFVGTREASSNGNIFR
jgi:hypothetical protein